MEFVNKDKNKVKNLFTIIFLWFKNLFAGKKAPALGTKKFSNLEILLSIWPDGLTRRERLAMLTPSEWKKKKKNLARNKVARLSRRVNRGV